MDKSILPGLSARLLILTLVFVMISEVMVFLPSIARFRERYLEERLATAHVAILASTMMPQSKLDKKLKQRLLKHADTYAIEERRPDGLVRHLQIEPPPAADATVRLDPREPLTLVIEALAVLWRGHDRILKVIGPSTKEPDLLIGITINEQPLRHAMIGYSARILLLSLIIALFTGMLVYFSLRKLIVTPMQHLAANMRSFRDNPEDASRIIEPSKRSDEIGLAQRNLALMQRDIRASLTQKARLVAIGEAVAKVNHDLRNILANAMLQSEKLARIQNPQVRAIVPILFKVIDEATALCRRTLDFVSNPQAELQLTTVELHDFVTKTMAPFFGRQGTTALSHNNNKPRFDNAIPVGLSINADPQHLSRALINLVKNALDAGANTITMDAQQSSSRITLLIKDNGPGLPSAIRAQLFRPFNRSKKSTGTGLGLAIVKDIMRAHDGDIRLKSSSKRGTVFILSLPIK